MIRVPKVRVIGAEGDQLGVLTVQEALKIAKDMELDLVEVASQAEPPVCRIMDYSRFKYDQEKKEKEAKKKQKVIHIKEVKFHPNIDKHDYATKLHHIERFLKRGDKAKVTMTFRGREMTRIDNGKKLLEKLATDLAPIAFIEKAAAQEGNAIIMFLMPK